MSSQFSDEGLGSISVRVRSGAGVGRGRAAMRLVHGPNHHAGSGTAVPWTLMIQKWRGGKRLAKMKHPALVGAWEHAASDGGRYWPAKLAKSG